LLGFVIKKPVENYFLQVIVFIDYSCNSLCITFVIDE